MRPRRDPGTREDGATRVLYIGGEGRSGSTILSTMLGGYDGVVPVGEFRNIWSALKSDDLCGCGEPVHLCAFWSRVGERAFGGWDKVDINAMLRADESYARHRDVFRHILFRSHPSLGLRSYRETLGRLYAAIGVVGDARVVVDSSKRAPYAYVLRDVPGIDLRVLHLVRDSRGVAYSNTKNHVSRPEVTDAQAADNSFMPVHPVWRTAIDWEVKSLLFYTLIDSSRLRRVTYEEIVASPADELRSILRFAGADPAVGGTWDEHTRSFESLPHHTVGGNPARFRRGRVRLEPDNDWMIMLTRRQKVLVSAMTFPLLRAYGYPIHRHLGKRHKRPTGASSRNPPADEGRTVGAATSR